MLRRITDFIRSSEGHLCGIDAGANIGDTILACAHDPKDKFLGLEPNPKFLKYLEANTRRHPNICIRQVVCASEDRVGGYHISTHRGTARFVSDAAAITEMKTVRLDTLLKELPEFKDCNFLRVDTDGHDFEVLRGARELIKSAMPEILFECDVFDNSKYVEDTLEALRFFAGAGYVDALVYDNLGYLFCHLKLSDVSQVPQMLFYQLINRQFYFDVLLLRDARAFLKTELDHFVGL